jgi:hypothetical protein
VGERDTSSIERLLVQTAVCWDRFLEIVDSVPAGRVAEPGVCGDWSVKTVIGHVAFWDGFEADRLGRGGEIEDVDYQPLNDENARETAGKSFAELRSQLETNHARVIAAVSAQPDLSEKYIRELLDDHYIDHGREIETWLAGA